MPISRTFLLTHLALLLAGLTAPLEANPLKDPIRTINGQSVDLSPLFRWWTNQTGERPLTAWLHITGTVVGNTTKGWIVQAQVERAVTNSSSVESKAVPPRKESQPGAADKQSKPGPAVASARILLQNPPLQELTEFETLSAELSSLNQQRALLALEQSQARTNAGFLANEQRAYRGRSRVVAAQLRLVKQAQTQASAQLKALEQQAQALRKRLAALPHQGYYTLDCLALDLRRAENGLPVFDHGLVVGRLP